MHMLSSEYRAAIRAVADACVMAKHLQSRLASSDTLVKSDLSPVTVADYAVQALICKQLESSVESFAMVGEEASAQLREPENSLLLDSLVRILHKSWPDVSAAKVCSAIDIGTGSPEATGYWTLDPIDGTKGFLRGGQYAVSLAYIVDYQIEFGVLGCPNLSADTSRALNDPDPVGQILYAGRGAGAWALPVSSGPLTSPTRVLSRTGLTAADLIRLCEPVESTHSNQAVTERIAQELKTAQPLRLDSQCKYAVVARGQADAYIRFPTNPDYIENIWDHAAGCIIAKEAGSVVTDIHGRELDFSIGIGLARNKGIVCAAPYAHEKILGVLSNIV